MDTRNRLQALLDDLDEDELIAAEVGPELVLLDRK